MSSFVKASGGITPNSADPGEEFPFLHTITVVDRVVSVDKPELVQNNIKTETVTLNLDSEWEGLSTVINIGNEKPVSVIWSGEPVVIPAELMTTVGSLDVSVVGYGDDGTPMSWGDEGLGSLITEENINQKICATPNVVMIVHGHNGGSIEEFETIIDEIRSEYPNMPIIVGAAMPLLGSWNKQLYRDRYDIGSPVISRGPQYTWAGNYATSRVQAAMNWINVEAGKNSSNGRRYENVWFFPMCVTTPTVEAVQTLGTISNGVREVKTFQPNGLPIEHPNYNAHFNWGVDLYGLLSWMFRDPSNPTNISDKNPIIPVRP